MTQERPLALPLAPLSVVFFLSGCAALLFETLWFRQAGLMLGNSVWASAVVLASFMGGLGLGNALAARHAALVVEGAGGLLVPLTPGETYADLAVALGLPVLVVARAGLGTVNHTALTVEALRARRLTVAGVVLNRTVPDDDASVPHNAGEIERLTGTAVLATLPYLRDITSRGAFLRSALSGKVHF